MLRTVEITAELAGLRKGEEFHNLHWQPKLELSLDCFICERTERTTSFEYGQEHAVCSGDQKHPQHPAAARIAGFDVTHEQERLILRAIVDYWWAPFHDTKRATASTAMTRWVRLYAAYLCPHSQQTGAFSTQSNVVHPVSQTCRCGQPLATSSNSPSIRQLT
ncbi:hypothetical protein [Streptomyces sp. NBC_01643]|uniref:hypothetical protein n=1 Tax=Streptomyces sp. NBC_01643 TaxID=2975906 RepID=UPI002F91BBBB|nr:hypothetical protein OHB03_47420 [Streptomyces sp. NBC_01643]